VSDILCKSCGRIVSYQEYNHRLCADCGGMVFKWTEDDIYDDEEDNEIEDQR